MSFLNLPLTRGSRIWGVPARDLVRRYDEGDLRVLLPPQSSVEQVVIRPATGSDPLKIETLRRTNREWLEPWEATLPPGSQQAAPSWSEYARGMDQSMRKGTGLLATIEADGDVAGCVSIGAVNRGAMSLGVLGYWIAKRWGGQGLTSLAVASVIDVVILELGLHRLEINVRTENAASLGVCRRLGLRQEGTKLRYMSIAGQWADHTAFAVDREDLLPTTAVQRLAISRASLSEGEL